jgi:hypothetical protein
VVLLDKALRAARPDDNRITADRGAAAGLAGMCGGLPLALRIAGALLGSPRQVWRLLCLRTASEFTRRQRFIVDFLVHFRRHIPAV